MSDNLQILPQAYGTPLVWVTYSNGDKMEFIDPSYNLDKARSINEFIVNLRYIYDEENDDECVITLQFQNMAQANAARQEEDTLLTAQWGYLVPGGSLIKSPKRTIAIRNINTNQTQNKLTIEWHCTDLVSYLRNTRTNRRTDANYFEDYLRELIDGRFTASTTVDRITTVISSTTKEVMRIDERRSTTTVEPISERTSILGVEHDKTVKVGWSLAVRSALEARLNEAKNGPFFIDGRDNRINILKRDFEQEPFATFTYAGNSGELIEFKTKTNLKSKKVDATKNTTVNPVTKEVLKNETHYQEGDQPLITDQEMSSVFKLVKKTWDWNKDFPHDQVEFNKIDIRRKQYQQSFKREDWNNPSVQRRDVTDVGIKPLTNRIKFSVPINTILNMPGFANEYNKWVMDNYILKKLEKQFTATARIMGDPTLITSKIYDFKNVLKDVEGEWYAIRIEHNINARSGYTCLLHLIRMPNTLGVFRQSVKTKIVSTDAEYIEEQNKVDQANEKRYEAANKKKENKKKLSEAERKKLADDTSLGNYLTTGELKGSLLKQKHRQAINEGDRVTFEDANNKLNKDVVSKVEKYRKTLKASDGN